MKKTAEMPIKITFIILQFNHKFGESQVFFKIIRRILVDGFRSSECAGMGAGPKGSDEEGEMKLMFLGPPGAGKGTAAESTRVLLRVPHISTGALFRENTEGETALGLQVKAIMKRGDLVPDQITVAMVRERLSREDARKGFILDGFPRTIPQAEELKGISKLDYVINFICGEDELIKRLSGRRSCPRCGRIYNIILMPPAVEGVCDDDGVELTVREDDREESVRRRLTVYTQATEPLIEWYRNSGLIRDVDAARSPGAVFGSVKELLLPAE